MLTFYQRLRRLRAERGLSQEQLANVTKLSKTCYQLVEIGKRDLTLSEAAKLSKFFGMSLDDLYFGLNSN